MNPKLQKLGTVAALLVMTATAQAGAPDPRHGDTKPLLVSLSRDAASSSRLSHSRASRPEDLSPLAYDALVFPDEAPEGRVPSSGYAVQLYPIDRGSHANGAAGPARLFAGPGPGGRGVARSEELSATDKTLLPEPGSWSMILVGLLGVGAIARRRMSA
jgi:hypothetical protein